MTVVPERIGKYQVVGVAGTGAMGVVYEAYDPLIDRKVAVKVPDLDQRPDAQAITAQAKKLFFNEAKAAGALDHPYIVKVYDAGCEGDHCYIAMEYIERADTLCSHVEAERLLPVDTVVDLMRQCAEALDYAHRKGVTHRDIKPANVLLTPCMQAKLADFGIAYRAFADQTQVIARYASPLYMSPEQARDEEVTGQSDLFSLAAVMYQLLTGRTPFEAKHVTVVMHNLLYNRPKPLARLRPDLPQRLCDVIERCLEKDLELRYRSGAELASDLGAVLEQLRQPSVVLSDDQKLRLAHSLKFFTCLSDPELGEVLKVASWESQRGGSRICREGAVEGSLYIVVTGEVSVEREGKTIAKLGEGECFGELGYLSQGRRTASVIAAEAVTLLRIDAPLADWASLSLQLRLSRALQQVLVERLSDATKRLARHLP